MKSVNISFYRFIQFIFILFSGLVQVMFLAVLLGRNFKVFYEDDGTFINIKPPQAKQEARDISILFCKFAEQSLRINHVEPLLPATNSKLILNLLHSNVHGLYKNSL